MKRLALLFVLLLPAPALAAPPANDRPPGAAEFETFTAGALQPGQKAGERQAIVDLTEATPDKGIQRCLGAGSFAKTVWLRVPAADVPQLVRVEASSPPGGGTSEVPDLALYVANQRPRVAQSCDGAAVAKGLSTSAAAVEAIVPANRPVLIQVGRTGGQIEQRVIASLFTEKLPAAKPPAGDNAKRATTLPVGSRRVVRLGGATLTAEDPAQPACPAAATVWRRTEITKAGRYRIAVRGVAAGSLTVFLDRVAADTAEACANRRAQVSAVALSLKLRKGTVLFTRIGADDTRAGRRVKAVVKRG